MISVAVLAKYGVPFRGELAMPCNVCSRCGESDDPESARGWALDAELDRVCPDCEEEGQRLAAFLTSDIAPRAGRWSVVYLRAGCGEVTTKPTTLDNAIDSLRDLSLYDNVVRASVVPWPAKGVA